MKEGAIYREKPKGNGKHFVSKTAYFKELIDIPNRLGNSELLTMLKGCFGKLHISRLRVEIQTESADTDVNCILKTKLGTTHARTRERMPLYPTFHNDSTLHPKLK